MTNIYVIVDIETRVPPKLRGPRTLPVYTTGGRAWQAMKAHRLPEEKYEVATFREADEL